MPVCELVCLLQMNEWMNEGMKEKIWSYLFRTMPADWLACLLGYLVNWWNLMNEVAF